LFSHSIGRAKLLAGGSKSWQSVPGFVARHDLRRSFCSRLAAEGVPLQIAQRLMRHASPTTTAAYYTNVEDVLHQAIAKV
jgi:integrase